MKNPNSTNRLFDLDRELDGDRPSPPPPTAPSPSGSGSLFDLEKAVGKPNHEKPNQRPQRQNHPSPPSPSGSGSLFHLEKAVEKPNQRPQPQNHCLQVCSFDDGGPIEMVNAGDEHSPMEARAFDFNEPIDVQQEGDAKASAWDKDYEDEIAKGDVPFQAAKSFEPEDEVFQAAESANETSSHSDTLAREVEALRHEVRSLQQPPAPPAQSSRDSKELDARLQEIRDEVKRSQWQKQQQPPEQTEAIAAQMEAISEELRSLRHQREQEDRQMRDRSPQNLEPLRPEHWRAIELEPTFDDFDRKMEEEQSPSPSEAPQHVPVEVVPPEAPHPQAKAMEMELSEQFAEFDGILDAETDVVSDGRWPTTVRQLGIEYQPGEPLRQHQQPPNAAEPQPARAVPQQPPQHEAQIPLAEERLPNQPQQVADQHPAQAPPEDAKAQPEANDDNMQPIILPELVEDAPVVKDQPQTPAIPQHHHQHVEQDEEKKNDLEVQGNIDQWTVKMVGRHNLAEFFTKDTDSEFSKPIKDAKVADKVNNFLQTVATMIDESKRTLLVIILGAMNQGRVANRTVEDRNLKLAKEFNALKGAQQSPGFLQDAQNEFDKVFVLHFDGGTEDIPNPTVKGNMTTYELYLPFPLVFKEKDQTPNNLIVKEGVIPILTKLQRMKNKSQFILINTITNLFYPALVHTMIAAAPRLSREAEPEEIDNEQLEQFEATYINSYYYKEQGTFFVNILYAYKRLHFVCQRSERRLDSMHHVRLYLRKQDTFRTITEKA